MMVSCTKSSSDGVPAMIQIDSCSVSTEYFIQGSGSSNIIDVWAYAGNDNLGTYELPNTIPILKEGSTPISLFAGIARSGVSSERAIYPFYNSYEFKPSLQKQEILKTQPVFKYQDNVKFPWKEDFEDLSIDMDSVPGSQVDIVRVNDPAIVFERKGCGGILLTSEKAKFTGRSQGFMTLPKYGNEVYLELDIRSNMNLEIVLKAYYREGSPTLNTMVTIKPTNSSGAEVWKKIYVYMTPYVSSAETAENYQVYFTSTLANGASEGHVYMDNLKVVHQ